MTPPPGQTETVSVTFISLDEPDSPIAAFAAWLTPAERDRWGAFPTAIAGRRFAVGRAALRRLLEAPASAGEFALGANGKPSLPGRAHFSFSASAGHALIAIDATEPIGVDLEAVRDVRVTADWPERYPALAAMRRGNERAQDGAAERFLRAWTRLEALIKRDGGRLANAIDRVRPAGTEGVEAVTDIELGHGFIGAVACRAGTAVRLTRASASFLIRGA